MSDENKPVVRREEMYIDDPQPESNPGCLRLLTIAGGCSLVVVVLLLVSVLGVVIFGVTSFASIVDGIGDAITGIFDDEPATATVVTTATVVNSIQPLGRLVSIEAQLAKADITVTVRDGPVLDSCTRTARHVAQGTIEAGIDLTQLSEADVRYNALNESYTVTLPTPQVTNCRMDFINQYNRSTSLCGPSWENIRLIGNYVALTEMRDDAIEGGILERARDEAETVLANFLQLSTGQAVNIRFADPPEDTPPVFPTSCEPPTPGSWAYDPASGTWQER